MQLTLRCWSRRAHPDGVLMARTLMNFTVLGRTQIGVLQGQSSSDGFWLTLSCDPSDMPTLSGIDRSRTANPWMGEQKTVPVKNRFYEQGRRSKPS